jgi:hypothetical protein
MFPLDLVPHSASTYPGSVGVDHETVALEAAMRQLVRAHGIGKLHLMAELQANNFSTRARAKISRCNVPIGPRHATVRAINRMSRIGKSQKIDRANEGGRDPEIDIHKIAIGQ